MESFGATWIAVLSGEEPLTSTLAASAKSIEHEDQCDGSMNDFERQDCRSYQRALRQAIVEGFRRRMILDHVSGLRIAAHYELAKRRWKINLWNAEWFSWYTRKPMACASAIHGLEYCKTLCGEVVLAAPIYVDMNPAEARPIADTYANDLEGMIAYQHVGSGDIPLPGCQYPHGQGYVPAKRRWYELARVSGILLKQRGRDSKTLAATGVFAP
jgi:hypothetical protein